ncbi:MAG: alpha/beta fold hydrolase [Chloroflexota bacterium]
MAATLSAQPQPSGGRIPDRRPARREQSRARYPDTAGYIERDDVRVFYEVYGEGEPTILLLPTWSIVHSRIWRLQIPYLARHYRVLTFDGRGNGRSHRPTEAAAYADTEFVDDAIAVLDATGTERALIVSVSMGAGFALRMAAEVPERVVAAVFEGPSVPLGEPLPDRSAHAIDEPLDRYHGWDRYNHHYWRQNYPDFLEFFFGKCFSEPHSTKQIEDAVGWGMETDAETLVRTNQAPYLDRDRSGRTAGDTEAVTRALAASVRCPSLVIHGTDDQVTSFSRGRELARALRAELVTLGGAGHIPHARDPVSFNLLLRDFIDRVHGSAASGRG